MSVDPSPAQPTAASIAAELAERITSGALAPGARVPSTREITRRWGVAMATATKALATLRDAGLVQTTPGAGTVVAAPARRIATTGPRSRRADSALTLARIVGTALRLADAEGLDAVSMRRVALDLGVSTMALYRHVRDKDELVQLMIDRVLGESPPPTSPAPPMWTDALAGCARELWQIYRRHPWLASALSLTRPNPLPNGLVFLDRVLAILLSRGFTPTRAMSLYLVLVNFTRGFGIALEPESFAEADTGMTADEWMDGQRPQMDAAMSSRSLPTLSAVLTSFEPGGYDFDLDQLFEEGLQCLLAGFASAASVRAAR